MILPILLTAGALWGAAPAQTAPQPGCTTTLCQINRARTAHGIPRLRGDRRLARAALRHSRDMVARRYFAHTSPSGLSPAGRVRRTGWMHGRPDWAIGENLAWHTGAASPRTIVRAWLRSAPHRRIMLDPAFRVVGIGTAPGTPTHRSAAGKTYTADFGS